MSIGIDQIFEMLSWTNDKSIQAQGVEAAKKIRNLSVFLQPIESKAIWENCAKVLVSKSDRELEIYLIDLFRWLQDMNWPGADLVYRRLKDMPAEHTETAYNISVSMADRTGDSVWKKVLSDFKNNPLP